MPPAPISRSRRYFPATRSPAWWGDVVPITRENTRIATNNLRRKGDSSCEVLPDPELREFTRSRVCALCAFVLLRRRYEGRHLHLDLDRLLAGGDRVVLAEHRQVVALAEHVVLGGLGRHFVRIRHDADRVFAG